MLVTQSTVYTGKQSEEGFVGSLNDHNFSAIISFEEGLTTSQGEALFNKFKTELFQTHISSLSEFESTVTNIIVKQNFPAHFSLAIGFLYNDALYVKTVGKGQVYFRRGKEFDLLMEGDKSASGYVQEYDLAVFTTTKIKDIIGTVEDIKTFVDLDPPKEITEKMQIEGYDEDAKGFISLFIEFLSKEAAAVIPNTEAVQPVAITTDTASEISSAQLNTTDNSEFVKKSSVEQPIQSEVTPPEITPPAVASPIANVEPVLKESVIPTTPPPITTPDPSKRTFSLPFFSSLQFKQSKKISLVIVAILFVILLWSVVFGYQRRMAAELQKKIDTTKQEIQTKLSQAEEDAYLDFDHSLALIEESKSQLSVLKQEVGDKKKEEMSQIETLINEAESKIVKRDEKESEEFYDLGLEAKDAEGEALYSEGDNVAILDKKNSTVYVLSVEKKSLDKYTSPDVASASLVALYDGTVFFLNSKGIYEFTSNTKTKLDIAEDDWGNIIDFQIYNGNMYLLDRESDEIYKYLVAEKGYSDKNSYFVAGQSVDLSSSVGMTIDSAIYIAQKNDVLKYVSGAQESFITEYPEKTPELAGIYTNTEIEQVYVWDKQAGIIFELNKDGEYQRQVASGIIRKAKGVFVNGDKVFVFDGKKLYTLLLT